MNTAPDARIPISFGGEPRPNAAFLVETGQNVPETGYAVCFTLARAIQGHVIGCACCSLRGPAADALGRMFMARARGEAPFFDRLVVLASAQGEAAIRQALDEDVVVRARYRVEEDDLGSKRTKQSDLRF